MSIQRLLRVAFGASLFPVRPFIGFDSVRAQEVQRTFVSAYRFSTHAFAALALICVFTVCANAQSTAQRTFVSTSGNDSNTASLCSALNPCRSFTSAQGVTTAGGEIIALSSGGYGAVTISKSLQITAPTGVYVAITAAAGDAITVNAASTDTVVLRGLTLNGIGGLRGIVLNEAGALFIESCIVNGFSSYGIQISDNGTTYIKNTIVRNSGNSPSGSGIYVSDPSGFDVTITDCRVENNRDAGLEVRNYNGVVRVRDTVFANNGSYGIICFGQTPGQTPQVFIDRCLVTGTTGFGVYAGQSGGAAVIRIAGSTVIHNQTGLVISAGATMESRGDNTVRANSQNVSGSITTTFNGI